MKYRINHCFHVILEALSFLVDFVGSSFVQIEPFVGLAGFRMDFALLLVLA